ALDRTILIVESKEDVDYLWSIGIPATHIIPTTKIARDKWKNADWTDFKNADVVVHARVQAACYHLSGIAKRVRILNFLRWTEKISGHTPEGAYTREELDEMIEGAPDYEPTPTPQTSLPIELGSKLWGPPTLVGIKEYRFGADYSKVVDLRRNIWFD